MEMTDDKKRITMKLKSPNPLFEKWITEWRDKARQENSKMEFCFNKALTSLTKYPLPLERGRDCKVLIGFGDKICQMLDRKLLEHKTGQHSSNETRNIQSDENDECYEIKENMSPKRKTRHRKGTTHYSPQAGSGGHVILITLFKKGLEPSYPGYLLKTDIIRESQQYSKNVFTKPDQCIKYTAWTSMKTLISKNLVKKESNPAKFSLTNEGLLLAKKLYDDEKGKEVKEVKNRTNILDDLNYLMLHKEQVVTDLANKAESGEDTKTEISSKIISTSGGNNEKSTSKTIKQYDSSTSTSSSLQKDIEELWKNEINDRVQYVEPYTKTAILVEGANQLQSCKSIQKSVSGSSIVSSTRCTQEETIIILPNMFDIILYVDTSETGGSNIDIQDDPILAELNAMSVPYEVKKLKVGDYVWICRDRSTKNELVLPYVIERKRMDDFGASIKDGRYHEQKFRLKRSGIQNITYLIESYGKNGYVGLPLPTLLQAATNTAVQDGFCIKFTDDYKHTAKFLADFTSLLTTMYKPKTLASCPKENLSTVSRDDDLISLMTFKEFNRSSAKNKPLKVSELFVKMLLQIKGLSVDKVLAIVRDYPTPEILRRVYEQNPGSKGEKLLSNISSDSKKNVGQVLSKTVYQLFTMNSF